MVKLDGNAVLEYATFKVPYEELNMEFRRGHKVSITYRESLIPSMGIRSTSFLFSAAGPNFLMFGLGWGEEGRAFFYD
ncbi:hypothetical protein Y032_0143g2403 [Ancylostoma ceylanicum]|uniref:Uncharacterized protein n=1 Tax=Ancylostoma ceylanicum TaxID=53326 RepID=A0A016T3C9_9BILA|nr:hypothetical protein Y032_0143g2403 [Ancylostoma ceylanicum]